MRPRSRPGTAPKPSPAARGALAFASVLWLLLAMPASAAGPEGAPSATSTSHSVVSAESPAGAVTLAGPPVPVAVTLSRTVTTPMLGFSVRFSLAGGLTTTPGAISEGGFLVASGATSFFQVTDLGGGQYVADGVTLGVPCGTTATSGTLFTVNVGSAAAAGTGTLTIDSVTLRDCANATLPSEIGTSASVTIDRSTPLVAVVSPNGGEAWVSGSLQTVTWSASDAEGIAAGGVSVEYSVDGGAAWLPVVSGLANSGSFPWTVPAARTGVALVRVTALDTNGNSGSDASDAVFTIQAASSTSLASAPNPSVNGQAVTLTASVSPALATGTVEFRDGVTLLGTAALSGGSAVLVTSALAAGSHSLTATYAGDALDAGSSSPVVMQVVDPAATSTAVSTAPNPSVAGQTVTLSASVSVLPPGAGTAIGTVEFLDGATSLGFAPLVAGSAELPVSTLAVGAHSITAVYAGGAGFGGSTSAPVSHTVNALGTSTTLASAPEPSTFGQAVTLTASVTPASATGSVEFFDGAASLGSAPLASGSAQLVTSALAAGSHSLTAVYSGDATHSGSTSAAHSHVVNAAATSVALVASPSPGVYLDPETLTATVSPAGASGSVSFFDGATPLGSAAVSGGSAVLVTSALAVGPHSLTAVYSGDANHAGASSAAVPLDILARITATAGANGSITPSGAVLVPLGATPSFTFAADPGHHVATVTVDGSPAPLTSPYTFAPVSANHTIDVQFAVNPPVAAIATLAATQVRSGNDADGTTRITLSWAAVPAGSTVEVWRKGFGNYPEYDDGPTPGSSPTVPGAYPPAGWTLTPVVSPGQADEPATRDVWSYVAYVVDTYGTRSAPSNLTPGTLNYHLGDVSDGVTVGQGDNSVTAADLSLLGAHYGISGAAVEPFNDLDVGPTLDMSVHARPATDNKLDFEDLVVNALNFAPAASAPQSRARPAAAASDALTLLVPPAIPETGGDLAVRVDLSGTGIVRALSVRLSWDPAVVTPVSWTAGDGVLEQGALLLSPSPGTVDGATLSGAGFTGEAEFATIHFRVLGPGAPGIAFAAVDARDSQNRGVNVGTGTLGVSPRVFATAFAPAMPNPFARATLFRFTLAREGRAELDVFSVDGRRVTTLAGGMHAAGEHALEWNGTGADGRQLPAGVYYARLVTPQGRFTRVVTLLR